VARCEAGADGVDRPRDAIPLIDTNDPLAAYPDANHPDVVDLDTIDLLTPHFSKHSPPIAEKMARRVGPILNRKNTVG
jgi:hypothetical protein